MAFKKYITDLNILINMFPHNIYCESMQMTDFHRGYYIQKLSCLANIHIARNLVYSVKAFEIRLIVYVVKRATFNHGSMLISILLHVTNSY